MQAHPQSPSAFRISSGSPLPQSGGASNLKPLPGPKSSLDEAAALAHDAGNILGALVLYCNLLQQPGVLLPRHQHYGVELMELARRSSGLIERLLAGIQDGKAPATALREPSRPTKVAPQPFPAGESYCPSEKLRELEPLLTSLAFPFAAFRMNLQAGLNPWSNPTPDALERIVVNLVCNAAQALAGYTPPRPAAPAGIDEPTQLAGLIVVSLRRTGRRTTLEVSDNGPGIPAAIAAAFLLPSTLAPGVAHGLGRRIIHEQATATGATLSVSSRPGKGACFAVSWLDHHRGRSVASGLKSGHHRPMQRSTAAGPGAKRSASW